MTSTQAPPASPSGDDRVPFRIHPRVFASLGAELVTSDTVALLELVKNSYDAGATRVDVRFMDTGSNGYIEIEDNGHGMTRSVIENVWCVVATPYRLEQTTAEGERRVSGEKGLGRLAAARLGSRLALVTKATGDKCWEVGLAWQDLSSAESLDTCSVSVRECSPHAALANVGTRIRITELRKTWSDEDLTDVREQLSRLISPFSQASDFSIYLSVSTPDAQAVRVEPPSFLATPPYQIQGVVDGEGNVVAKYTFSHPTSREVTIERRLWSPLIVAEEDSVEIVESPKCGPFAFEIRAWDIDTNSIRSLAERFDLKRSTIRADIRKYQGISLYRDGILVLPKSDASRDWLGLDLRRVSKVGERVSTSQIVGYVTVTADNNSAIRDTSDRERLEDNDAARDFRALLVSVVKLLEDERSRDRQTESKKREQPFRDLFSSLSPDSLTKNVAAAAERGARASEVLPLVEEYAAGVAETVGQIERRLIHYSGLASLGTIAGMLTHEVRNHSIAIGRLCRDLRKLVTEQNPIALKLERQLALTEHSVATLQRLADTFAPLSNAAFRSRRRNSVLQDVVAACLELRLQRSRARKVVVNFAGKTDPMIVAVDPGELTTVILNLLDNSLYWLSFTPAGRERRIQFVYLPVADQPRVVVRIDDSGPGIAAGDEERVFWPGVTGKKEGIGMGLTVAAEIVTQHGGSIALVSPGYLGGASFQFDLPLKMPT